MHRERRRAPDARRDDREYREYSREEQRSSRGAAAFECQSNFRDRTLGDTFDRSREIVECLGREGFGAGAGIESTGADLLQFHHASQRIA